MDVAAFAAKWENILHAGARVCLKNKLKMRSGAELAWRNCCDVCVKIFCLYRRGIFEKRRDFGVDDS